jgi:hypothetical protein
MKKSVDERQLVTLLDRLENGQSLEQVLQDAGGDDPTLRSRLEAAWYLHRGRPALAARPAYLAASRRNLQSRLATAPRRQPAWLVWWSLRPVSAGQVALRLALAVWVVISLMLGSTGAAFAAQEALPGEALYPLKIGLELAQLSFARDPAQQAQVHIRLAQIRLVEIQALVLEDRVESIPQLVDDFDRQVAAATQILETLEEEDEAQAARLATQLSQTLTVQQPVMQVLVTMAPDTTSVEIERARSISERGIQSVSPLPERPNPLNPPGPEDASEGVRHPADPGSAQKTPHNDKATHPVNPAKSTPAPQTPKKDGEKLPEKPVEPTKTRPSRP